MINVFPSQVILFQILTSDYHFLHCLLFQLGKTKGNEKICQWTDHIINHFWYCCSNCDGPESKLKVKKNSCLLFIPAIIYCHTVPACVNSLHFVCVIPVCCEGPSIALVF